MSKGNILQGQATGKLGDTVLMVRNGKQVARVYTTAGARSGKEASEAARIQRVKFGSASNQWGLYRYVSTRMYRKGRKSNQSDYNYFVKRNASLLPYFTKEENATGVHVLMPGQFSEGNMGRIELFYEYTPTPAEGQPIIRLRDTLNAYGESINWTSTVGDFKSVLAVAYPNARKFTFLFSIAPVVSLLEEGEMFLSQEISHDVVTFDLYSEEVSGENNLTVNEFFANHVRNKTLKAIFSAQTSTIGADHTILAIRTTNAEHSSFVANLGILAFATDDNVSDCYTTTLPQGGVNPLQGAFSVWTSYRTSEALRIAADSYGYQSGVMRDIVASVGNEIEAAVATYAKTLRVFDAKAAEAFLADVMAAGGAKARTVREKIAPTEGK